MQTSIQNITTVLLFGFAIMALLILFILVFVIFYQRRMLNQFAEMQRSQAEKQREVLHAIFKAHENDRRRLASGLHDSVGKVLSVIKINLHQLEKQRALVMGETPQLNDLLARTRQLSEEAFEETQNIIWTVQPPLLADFGLVVAISDVCTKINESTYFRVFFQYNDNYFRLRQESECSIFRIVQELFNNTIQHSGATQIDISLYRTPEEITLTFTDNGSGFYWEKEPLFEGPHGHGLKNIESRIELMGGSFQLDTYPRAGTKVEIKLNARLMVL